MKSSAEKSEAVCPLANVDRRLDYVHQQWHKAEQAYFHPDAFRMEIQTAIQTLRTVTFLLNKNRDVIPNFDQWYGAWQIRLGQDPLMKWMKEARNKIEKEGDLNVKSFVRAEIIAAYMDGPQIDVPAHLFDNPIDVIERIPSQKLRSHIAAHGTLRVHRRWVENTLPDYELLDAVAIAFGKIAQIVQDAHRQIGLIDTEPDGNHGCNNIIPCMNNHVENRTVDFSLEDGKPVSIDIETRELSGEELKEVSNRYSDLPTCILTHEESNEDEIASNLFSRARLIFLKDGYHHSIFFILKECEIIDMVSVELENRAQKYLIMRTIADLVRKYDADAVIALSEVWTSRFDEISAYEFPADSPSRGEALTATLVTRHGDAKHFSAAIRREAAGIALDDTLVSSNEVAFMYAPVYKIWNRPIPDRWIEVERQHTGEPKEKADSEFRRLSKIPAKVTTFKPKNNQTCLCGSGRKYKKCCHGLMIENYKIGHGYSEAIKSKDFEEALKYSRSDITKYTIWHKSHTEPWKKANAAAADELVKIDIRALTSYVERLFYIYMYRDQTDEFFDVLDRLRTNIKDPRWRRKLHYYHVLNVLGWRWDTSAGKQEFKKYLGEINYDETDLEIIQLYADLFRHGIRHEDKIVLFDRIIDLSDDVGDRLQYQTAKAVEFLLHDNADEAEKELADAVAFGKSFASDELTISERHKLAGCTKVLATTRQDENIYQEAVAILVDILETNDCENEEVLTILRDLAESYTGLKSWGDAETTYRKAIAISPLSIFNVFLSEIFLEKGEYGRAIKEIDACKIEELDRDEYFDYVMIYSRLSIITKDVCRLEKANVLLEKLGTSAPAYAAKRFSMLSGVQSLLDQLAPDAE